MTLVINAFISFHRSSFHRNSFPNEYSESGRFIPTEADILLSALEPFRNSQMFKVRIYDLETPGGRLRGFLHGISEAPAVIIAGEQHIGLAAVGDSLNRLLNEIQTTKTAT